MAGAAVRDGCDGLPDSHVGLTFIRAKRRGAAARETSMTAQPRVRLRWTAETANAVPGSRVAAYPTLGSRAESDRLHPTYSIKAALLPRGTVYNNRSNPGSTRMRICKNYFLCIALSLLAASQAWSQSLVGAWTPNNATDATVIVFFSNGYYYHAKNVSPSDAPGSFPGFERGTYTWNQVTGAFTVKTLQDLNGDDGLSDLNQVSGLNIKVSGDAAKFTITPNEIENLSRVAGTSRIVGAWSLGNPTVNNSSAVVVFMANGTYMMAEDGDSSVATGDPTGHDGIEHGTYSWNPTTGTFTSSRSPAPYNLDTTGEWGLSNTGPMTMQISADGLTLTATAGNESSLLSRVGAPSTSNPSLGVTSAAIEYYHAVFDHYFLTAIADEITKLDNGTFAGWARTSKSFNVYATAGAGATTVPVCRFFSTAFGIKSSHFYSGLSNECTGLQSNKDWQLEGFVFNVSLPASDGGCPAGHIPVYRVYNNGQGAAPNHRFTTDLGVRKQMLARGFVPEGNGAGVSMCSPS